MKQRTLVILGAAAILSVGTALVLTPSSDVETPPGAGKLAFEGLASRLRGATRIEIDKHDGRLVLERKGDAWVAADHGGYPVRPERVRELLVGLTEVRLLEPRTADPAMHERLGVEDPSKPGSTGLLVRVQEPNGAPLAELVVGRRRVRTQGNLPESAYIRRPGEAQAWLAEGRLSVDADPQLWLDRDVVNLPSARVREVAVRRADEPELVLARADQTTEGEVAKLALSAPPGFEATDESAVDEVGRALEFVTFLDVKAEGDIPGEAAGESRFILADGLAVVVTAFREGDKLWLRLGAEGDGAAQTEAERLNARWRGWAYQVAPWKEKAVLPRLSDLGGRSSTSDATPATQGSIPLHAATPSTAPEAAPAGAASPSSTSAQQTPASSDMTPAAASYTAPADENGATAPSPTSPISNRTVAAAPGTDPSSSPAASGGRTVTTAPSAHAASAPTSTAPSAGAVITETAMPSPPPASTTATTQTAKPRSPERAADRNHGSSSGDKPQHSSAPQPR